MGCSSFVSYQAVRAGAALVSYEKLYIPVISSHGACLINIDILETNAY